MESFPFTATMVPGGAPAAYPCGVRLPVVGAIIATTLALGIAVIAAVSTLSASEIPPTPVSVVDVDTPGPSPTGSPTSSPDDADDDHGDDDDDHEGDDDDD